MKRVIFVCCSPDYDNFHVVRTVLSSYPSGTKIYAPKDSPEMLKEAILDLDFGLVRTAKLKRAMRNSDSVVMFCPYSLASNRWEQKESIYRYALKLRRKPIIYHTPNAMKILPRR